MSKLARCLALVAATAVVFAAAFSAADAQDKKAARPEKVGTVEVFKDKAGNYRFRIKDTNGKVVANCTKGYDKKDDAVAALEFVKDTLTHAKVSEVGK